MDKINMSKKDSTFMINMVGLEITKLLVVHILFVLIDGKGVLFSDEMVKTMLYSTMAIALYFILIKKFVE